MNLRDALVYQSPSLALQRAAADEIAVLDDSLLQQDYTIVKLEAKVEDLEASLAAYSTKSWRDDHYIRDLEDYLEAEGLIEDFNDWLTRNTEE